MTARTLTLEQRKANVLNDLDVIERDMDYLILATPTGEVRNNLTEANIHLLAAKAALEKVKLEEPNGN